MLITTKNNSKKTVCELYGKLRTAKGYSRHLGSLYRVFRKLGYSGNSSTKKPYKPYHPIYSNIYNREFSDKNRAFYFKKNFMKYITSLEN